MILGLISQLLELNLFPSRTVTLDSWRGKQYSKHKLAKISIEIGNVKVDAVVAVVDKLDCPALLGDDLGVEMRVKLLSMILEKAKAAQTNSVSNEVSMQEEVVRATRAQVEKERVEDEENALASAQSECEPIPLSDIYDFPDTILVMM